MKFVNKHKYFQKSACNRTLAKIFKNIIWIKNKAWQELWNMHGKIKNISAKKFCIGNKVHETECKKQACLRLWHLENQVKKLKVFWKNLTKLWPKIERSTKDQLTSLPNSTKKFTSVNGKSGIVERWTFRKKMTIKTKYTEYCSIASGI